MREGEREGEGGRDGKGNRKGEEKGRRQGGGKVAGKREGVGEGVEGIGEKGRKGKDMQREGKPREGAYDSFFLKWTSLFPSHQLPFYTLPFNPVPPRLLALPWPKFLPFPTLSSNLEEVLSSP